MWRKSSSSRAPRALQDPARPARGERGSGDPSLPDPDRRPPAAAAGKFNGTAIVEWTNVSQGHDNEVDWFQSGAHFVRSGYAWIGVSAQRVGVDALKQWSPARYGTLDVSDGGTITNDALSYDIFTAAAQAVRGQAGPTSWVG